MQIRVNRDEIWEYILKCTKFYSPYNSSSIQYGCIIFPMSFKKANVLSPRIAEL